MAVISCNEQWLERSGTQELGGQDNEGATHSYTRVFQVITDDPEDDAQVVMFAPGLPAITDWYESGNDYDNTAECVRVYPQQEEQDRRVWKVIVTYESNREKGTAPDRNTRRGNERKRDSKEQDNPLDRPRKISVSFQRWVEVFEEDITGKRTVNTAGEPLDPPLEYELLMPVIRVTKNVETFFPSAAGNQAGVNSSAMLGYPAGHVRQTGVEAELRFENGVRYWEVVREFMVRPRPWNPTAIKDFGFCEIEDGMKRMILVDIGARPKEGTWHPITMPHPLNGAGKRAKVGEQAANRYFWFYPEFDYNPLIAQPNPRPRRQQQRKPF